MSPRWVAPVLAVSLLAIAALSLWPKKAASVHPARGFRDEVVLSGLQEPMAVAFARDGRVFVAERRGVVKVFSRLNDPRPRVLTDLREHVYELGDHGIFGLALDSLDRVYVLYTFDGPVGARVPVWRDRCPGDANSGRCPVSGRISRLAPNGREHVLVAGWCQQFSSHGVGALAFGPDGSLYASGGEGASYERVDDGRFGNPCADPPGEGGALRAQDARTLHDPLGLSGSVIRVDPTSGRHRPVAFGLRNPFRFAVRPGTSELWIGEVGSTRSDELNVVDASAGDVPNFGWPCYEGERRLRSYDEANLPLCEELYEDEDDGAVTEPLISFPRGEHVVAGDPCLPGKQALSGLAFYERGSYPARYRGALFFADFARRCMWTMLPGEDGRPDPKQIELFRTGLRSPVYLTAGPGGDLYYVDFFGGALRRISHVGRA